MLILFLRAISYMLSYLFHFKSIYLIVTLECCLILICCIFFDCSYVMLQQVCSRHMEAEEYIVSHGVKNAVYFINTCDVQDVIYIYTLDHMD